MREEPFYFYAARRTNTGRDGSGVELAASLAQACSFLAGYTDPDQRFSIWSLNLEPPLSYSLPLQNFLTSSLSSLHLLSTE